MPSAPILVLMLVAGDELAAERPSAVTETNAIGMELRLIPAGTFTMGASAADVRARHDETQRSVTITRPFLMATTEVTQAQWLAVMKSAPWRGRRSVREGAEYPVSYVTWDQAAAFCRALSAREQRTYRLPTEAEWEYACRGGQESVYGFGNDVSRLPRYAWIGANTVEQGETWSHPVAQKKPNAWGLFDMHGNNWEWCGDWYHKPASGAVSDPTGPQHGQRRVMKGGSWHGTADLCRCASRFARVPRIPSSDVGFRVVLEPAVAAP